jgi:hypothetical protein
MKKNEMRKRVEYTRQVVSKKLRKLHGEKLDNVCSTPLLLTEINRAEVAGVCGICVWGLGGLLVMHTELWSQNF